jgi:hypothetical protein
VRETRRPVLVLCDVARSLASGKGHSRLRIVAEHGTRRPQPAAAPKPQSCTSPREVRGDKDQRVLHAPSLTKTAASGAPSRGSRVLTRNLSHRLLFADADENGPNHPQDERAIHHKRRGENVHSPAAPG